MSLDPVVSHLDFLWVWLLSEGEGTRSSRIVESQLADFLVFLRRIVSLRGSKRVSSFGKWIDPLMSVVSHRATTGALPFSVCIHVKRLNNGSLAVSLAYKPSVS